MSLKRLRRWGFRVMLGVFLLVVAVLVGAPLLVSGAWGRGRIEALLSEEFGRPVRLAELDFGWLGGFEARGVSVGGGTPSAIWIRAVRARPDLLSLTADRVEIGLIEAEGVAVTLVLTEDGSLVLRGWEPSFKRRGESLLAGARFSAEVKDSSIQVTDVTGAVLVALSGFDGAARREHGLTTTWEFASVHDGIRAEGIATEGPPFELGGQIELAAFDLSRLAPVLAGLGGPAGLAGRIEGRVAFSAGAGAPVEVEASLRARDPRFAVRGGPGWAGNVEIAGRLTRSEGRVDLVGWQVDAPGVSLYLASASTDGDSFRAQGRIAASLPELRDGLTGVDLPLLCARLGVQATVSGRRAHWTAGLEAFYESANGSPLVAPLPCLGARVTLAGTLEGRDGFARLSLGEGVGAGGGGMRVEITGTVESPFRAERTGRVALRVETVCRPVPRSLLAGPTIFSEGGGDVALAIDGSRLTTEVDLSFTEFSVARPVGPAVEEPGLVVSFSGGVDILTGEAFVDRLDLAGTRIAASVEGSLAGLPRRPRGTARVRVAGQVSSLAPLFPAAETPRSGAFALEIRAEPAEGATGFSGSLVLTEYDLGAGLADRESSVRFALRVPVGAGPVEVQSLIAELPPGRAELSGSFEAEGGFRGRGAVRGDLARIPAAWRSFLPPLAGLFAGPLVVSVDRGGARLSGELGIEGLRVGGVFEAESAKLEFTADLGEELRIAGLELTSGAERITFDGRFGGPGKPVAIGSARWTGSLASLPPGVIGEGLRSEGSFDARAEIDESGAGSFALSGGDVRIRGPGEDGIFYKAAEVAVGASFTWPGEAGLPRFSRVNLKLPAGTVAIKGDLDPDGPSRADVDLDLDLAAVVRDHPALFPAGLKAEGRLVGDMVFAGDPGRGDADALGMLRGSVDVTIARVAWPGYDATQGRLVFRIQDGTARLSRGEAVVNSGQVNLAGALDFAAPGAPLTIGVITKGVRLSAAMEPEVRYLVPLFGNAGGISGELDLDGELETLLCGGVGAPSNRAGAARVSVGKGSVSGSPVLLKVLSWLDGEVERPTNVEFERVSGAVTLLEGRALTEDLVFVTGGVTLAFSGYTGLDGSIDYKVGVLLPEGAAERTQWKDRLTPDGAIPIRMVGTLDAPALRAPDAADVAGSLLEDLLRRARERRESRGAD